MSKSHSTNVPNAWGTTYDRSIAAPAFSDAVVATLADLTTISNWLKGSTYVHFKGMTVAVEATNKLYVYIGATGNSTQVASNAYWRKVGNSYCGQITELPSSLNDTNIGDLYEWDSATDGTISTDKSITGEAIDIVKGNIIIYLGNNKFNVIGSSPKIATSTKAGLVKSQSTGSTANRYYNVEVQSTGLMRVNVPWTDTDTTYTAGDGITITNNTISLNAASATEVDNNISFDE